MNKTIYIREEDAGLWERARELAGDSLSRVIVEALKRFVADKENVAKGFDRIVVVFEDSLDSNVPKKKAFYGRWIFTPQNPDVTNPEDGDVAYKHAVAETAKGGWVVLAWDAKAQYDSEHDGRWESKQNERFVTFSNLREATSDPKLGWLIRNAVNRRGVAVEELDI